MAPGVFKIEPFHNILIFWDTEFGVFISFHLYHKLKEINTWNNQSVWNEYTLYKFHFLNGISEINQLFDDILIIWPAPIYIKKINIASLIFVRSIKKLFFWPKNVLIYMKACFCHGVKKKKVVSEEVTIWIARYKQNCKI